MKNYDYLHSSCRIPLQSMPCNKSISSSSLQLLFVMSNETGTRCQQRAATRPQAKVQLAIWEHFSLDPPSQTHLRRRWLAKRNIRTGSASNWKVWQGRNKVYLAKGGGASYRHHMHTYEYGEAGTPTTKKWFFFRKSRHSPLWFPRTSRSQTWRH